MRLLRIITSTDPEAGGVIESVLQASVALKGLGHEVELLSLDAPSVPWLESLPIKAHAIGPAVTNYAYCPRIKNWLEQHHMNYDAFIIDGLWQYHGMATRRALLKLGRSYYVYTHGMLDPWFKKRYPLKHIKKWFFWPWSDYLVLRDAKKVLFTTEEEMAVSSQSFWLYRCNGEVAPIGTSAFQGNVDEAKAEFYAAYPELKHKPYLLFLSRIHPKKGVDLLIEAFAQNQHLNPDLQLVIAGPDQMGLQGDFEQLAQRLGVSNKIIWTGMLKANMKWGAYHNSDAFILPSHQENFGIVVAEALSCGVPTLISDKVNIWREVKKDGAGIVEDDTLQGCSSLISQWINLSHQQRSCMINETTKCFNRNFEITKSAENLIEVVCDHE